MIKINVKQLLIDSIIRVFQVNIIEIIIFIKLIELFSRIDFSDKHVHVKFADASNKNKKMYKTGLDVSNMIV